MNSSSLLSADFSASLPRSGSGKIAVEGKATAESVKGDLQPSAASNGADRFASELNDVISDKQDMPASAAKKVSSDNIDPENQVLGFVSAQTLSTEIDSDVVSDDVQLAEIEQIVDVSKLSASATESEQISGKQADSQETALDPEDKHQIMADAEELLNRLSAANQQLSESHSAAGKTLPPDAATSDTAKPLMSQMMGSVTGDTTTDASSDTGSVAATATMAAGTQDPAGLPLSEADVQSKSDLSPEQLANVFAASSAQVAGSDSQASELLPNREDIASQVIDPQVMAGMAVTTDGEQAVAGKVRLSAQLLPADMPSQVEADNIGGLSKLSLTTSGGALATTLAAAPATVVNGTVMAAPVDGATVIPWATTQASSVLAGAMVTTTAGVADPTTGDTALVDSAVNSAALAATVEGSANLNAETKPADIAHQISSLSGQQSINGQAKSEALAQAQTPLQLSKEQAGDQVAERVNMMMSKNLKHVDIRLDPPELGKLQIKLSLNQDQASVQFTVGNQQTRDLIEQAMPRLREMLHQQGLQLAQSTVQQDGSRQQLGQSGQQGGTQQQSGGSDHTGGESEMGHSGSEAVEMFVKQADDRVDYYA
ncbi:flagellar hook-length control protein FliK [Photobacterium sp.]|uniref:flagellar hook-length control protein FliK n=1 Tax=Photobacterium sp. TaxID=660 RepID=UPI00299EEE23|nr:flagellar hook-length control protein FliK [Photobacterium sp.]MDX1302350.1 flagellar hook-length control protein FliK [Photobacterium sp.]